MTGIYKGYCALPKGGEWEEKSHRKGGDYMDILLHNVGVPL